MRCCPAVHGDEPAVAADPADALDGVVGRGLHVLAIPLHPVADLPRRSLATSTACARRRDRAESVGRVGAGAMIGESPTSPALAGQAARGGAGRDVAAGVGVRPRRPCRTRA